VKRLRVDRCVSESQRVGECGDGSWYEGVGEYRNHTH
jgi:hypothetical protein